MADVGPSAAGVGPMSRPGRHISSGMVLALVCVGQYMVVLDLSIVNVALPSMQRDLGFTTSGLQWVVNAYALSFGGFLLLGGRAADLFGRRRVFMLGLLLFAGASLVCAVAQNQFMLVGARALQGVGAAVLSPATLTILTMTFREPAQRSRALGIWSAMAAVGGASGALFGGILTDLLSWRWIFYVNVPIAAATLVAARRRARRDPGRGRATLARRARCHRGDGWARGRGVRGGGDEHPRVVLGGDRCPAPAGRGVPGGFRRDRDPGGAAPRSCPSRSSDRAA